MQHLSGDTAANSTMVELQHKFSQILALQLMYVGKGEEEEMKE